MTPWESLLQSNNGSSIIKQLALIAFFILEYYIYKYIYIYIYIYIYSGVMESGFVATCRLWTASGGVHALLVLEPRKERKYIKTGGDFDFN